MKIKIYIKKNNSYFLKLIYPSGKNSGNVRITKKQYYAALDYANANKSLLKDLVIKENEIYFTEI